LPSNIACFRKIRSRLEGMKTDKDNLLFVADIAGTFLFATEGAIAGVHGNLDLLGLVVLAFATAMGGGIPRDGLIGALPLAALRDWRYPVLAFVGAFLIFFLHPYVMQLPAFGLVILDAAALSLFAVAGPEKALAYGIHPFIAILLGTVTAVGGGTIRDLFLARVPLVLQRDIYATAAMLGSACMIAGRKLRLGPKTSSIAGGLICFSLRVISVWRHWNLPKVFNS
jgi:uncharacterized membrane protein YeiH